VTASQRCWTLRLPENFNRFGTAQEALSRSQTVVTFSWFKAGVYRTWARSR
jgi:hypothetical protein